LDLGGSEKQIKKIRHSAFLFYRSSYGPCEKNLRVQRYHNVFNM